MSVVFTNGCFDLLHSGHFKLLRFCERLAGDDGKIFIALDSDEKVKKDKGSSRPIFTFEERKRSIDVLDLKNLEEISCFNTNEELLQLIKNYGAEIVVKSDQWAGNVVGSSVAKAV